MLARFHYAHSFRRTLTLAVEGDEVTVHTLTLSAAQDVVDWPLINLLRRLEGERE